MARKRLGFALSLREQRTAVARQLAFMASAAPDEKREAAEAHAAAALAALPQKRKTSGVRRDLEGPVIAAISQLLAVHPRIIWISRFNSGAAMSASGAPVVFHRVLREPFKTRLVDFFGLYEIDLHYTSYENARPIAIEAKHPLWTKPRDDREREQAAFLAMIRGAGGIGIFATSAEDVAAALK